MALDLTAGSLLESLGLTVDDLTAKDRRTCQELAELALETGFDAIIGPSAARPGDTTLAVFSPAFTFRSHDVIDLGIRRPR